MNHSDLSALEAVIFDVDGTLYDQKKLRRRMCMSLAMRLWRDPQWLRTCKIIQAFRRYREALALTDAKTSLAMQYDVVARQTRQQRDFVEHVIDHWIFKQPLKHLAGCLYDGVDLFFKTMAGRGLKIGVFSDYAADEKLSAMGLAADIIICSTDAEVQRLKPHPRGLLLCCERLDVASHKVLYIGDRDDLDGECARRAKVPYLILPSHQVGAREFYRGLTHQLRTQRRIEQKAA